MSDDGIEITDGMEHGIALAEVLIPRRLEEETLRIAVEALDWAKQNAPWEDRTGMAREGLDTDVTMEHNTIIWTLYHTVDYGQWLETIQNGRFRIIMPTLEQFAGKLANDVSGKVVIDDYGQ